MKKRKGFGIGAVIGSALAAAAVVSLLKNKKKEVKVEEKQDRVVRFKRGRGFKKIVLNPRQQELYEYIRENDSVVMGDIMGDFLDVSERTLRRDLVYMVENELIDKEGSTKASKYIFRK